MAMEVAVVLVASVSFTNLVSLPIYIKLEGRMIPRNDTLDEADRPSYGKHFWAEKSPFWAKT